MGTDVAEDSSEEAHILREGVEGDPQEQVGKEVDRQREEGQWEDVDYSDDETVSF